MGLLEELDNRGIGVSLAPSATTEGVECRSQSGEGSTASSSPAVSKQRCRSRQGKRVVLMPLPKIVRDLACLPGMVGIDHFDEAVANYSVHLRSKKWCRPIFDWSIYALVVNAWRLHQKVTVRKENMLDFTRKLTMRMLLRCTTSHRRAALTGLDAACVEERVRTKASSATYRCTQNPWVHFTPKSIGMRLLG